MRAVAHPLAEHRRAHERALLHSRRDRGPRETRSRRSMCRPRGSVEVLRLRRAGGGGGRARRRGEPRTRRRGTLGARATCARGWTRQRTPREHRTRDRRAPPRRRSGVSDVVDSVMGMPGEHSRRLRPRVPPRQDTPDLTHLPAELGADASSGARGHRGTRPITSGAGASHEADRPPNGAGRTCGRSGLRTGLRGGRKSRRRRERRPEVVPADQPMERSALHGLDGPSLSWRGKLPARCKPVARLPARSPA